MVSLIKSASGNVRLARGYFHSCASALYPEVVRIFTTQTSKKGDHALIVYYKQCYRRWVLLDCLYTVYGVEVVSYCDVAVVGSCSRSCSPSDFYSEGKCGVNGCVRREVVSGT